jgi:hypothetical protein
MGKITIKYLIERGFNEVEFENVIYYRKGNYILTQYLETFAIVGIIGNQFVVGEICLTTIKDLHRNYLESTGIELSK